MLDQETLRPVVISMALYVAIAKIVPEGVKKPTNIGFIDDIVSMLIAQKGAIASGAILTGLIVLLTNYIIDESNVCGLLNIFWNDLSDGDIQGH